MLIFAKNAHISDCDFVEKNRCKPVLTERSRSLQRVNYFIGPNVIGYHIHRPFLQAALSISIFVLQRKF